MRLGRICTAAAIVATLAAGALDAKAATIAITNVAVSTAGTTGNSTSGTARRITTSSILDAGESTLATIGATVDGSARFTMAAETRAASGFLGTTQNDYNANYTVTFDVIADPGVVWDLEIVNTRLGVMLTGSGGGTGKADITGSTGLVNGVPVGSLALADQGSLTSENGTAGIGPIGNTGSTTVSGVGSASYSLNFTWSSEADSTQGAFSKGDKVGVLMGSDIAWSETDAQVNYQPGGNAGHFLATDGHFVYMTATVVAVPEPGSLAIAAIGALCFGVVAVRRRK